MVLGSGGTFPVRELLDRSRNCRFDTLVKLELNSPNSGGMGPENWL